MKKPTRVERLERFERDSDAWLEGKLELVTRRFELHDAPNYSAEDVKRMREDLNMSQAQFGKLIGVSGRTVESWEHGHRTPDGAATRTMEMYSQPPWRDQVRLPEPPAAGRPRAALQTTASIPPPTRSAKSGTAAARKSRTIAAAAPKTRRGPGR